MSTSAFLVPHPAESPWRLQVSLSGARFGARDQTVNEKARPRRSTPAYICGRGRTVCRWYVRTVRNLRKVTEGPRPAHSTDGARKNVLHATVIEATAVTAQPAKEPT